MTDISYNIDTMELNILNGDFMLNTSISEQNGGIIMATKNVNLYYPMLGIAFGSSKNDNQNDLFFSLNLWQQQVKQDGAITAKWSIITNKDGSGTIKAECNYGI
jgi:hypothetical protein